MEENNIRKYAKLLHELGLSALEISENGSVVRLECAARGGKALVVMPEPEKAPKSDNSGLTDIRSPMVGVFYAAPGADAEPFVKPGDTVRRGEVICIIEAMKLMNEITAEEDGVIAESCVENNQPVDFGQVLFKIKKD